MADTVMYGLTFIAENGYNREVLKSARARWDNWREEDGLKSSERPGSGGWGNQFSPISMSTKGATDNYFEIPMSEFIKNNTCE